MKRNWVKWISRNRIGIGMGLLLLIILAVVLILVFGGKDGAKDDPSSASSQSPSSLPGTSSAASGSDLPDGAVSLPQTAAPKAGDSVAVIKTDRGDLTFALYQDYAPASVNNFISMAQSGSYEGLLFSAGAENSFLEIAAPESGSTYANEMDLNALKLFHLYGALGVAQDENGRPTNRFTIITGSAPDAATMRTMTDSGMWPEEILSLYRERGGLPACDGRYTVFGQLVEGEEVLQMILSGEIPETSASSASSESSQSSSPGKRTRVLSISIEEYAG